MNRQEMLVREVRAATYRLIDEQCAGLSPRERVATMQCIATIALFNAVRDLSPEERAAFEQHQINHEYLLVMYDSGA